ncbi:MAG: hypothetical protein AAFV49_04505 [Pseudomonadota bacterium]
MRILALVLLLALPAGAGERDAFYGTWGTEKQCAGEPITPRGTVPAAPYVIGPDWLRHGRTWCRLAWYPLQPREDGMFTAAEAQCGEDSVRDYFLRMERVGETLILRWDFLLTTGPMRQCPDS